MQSSDYMIGNCCGCSTFPTVLFRVPSTWTEHRFRCATCFKTDVGHEHPDADAILNNFRSAVEPKLGKMSPKGSLFMSVAVGDAKTEEDSYTLAATMTGYAPQVTSKNTGKTFTLGWEDVIALAIREGVSRDC